MILDRLENAKHYFGLHPHIDEALTFLINGEFNQLPLGRHSINPNLDAIIDEYETQAADTSQYEAHQRYIDVQYLIAGDEYMGIAPLTNQQPSQPYNDNEDYALYQIAGQMIHVKSGMFVIFFPTDLHMPCIGTPPRKIKKVVMKARVETQR
jgi:YhcH/YjgK/YiaL family protein